MTTEYLSTVTPLTNEEGEKFIKELAQTNERAYNKSKLLEELLELSELIIKWINKSPERQPTAEAIMEEIADVVLRLNVLVDAECMDEEWFSDRILRKLAVLKKLQSEGKYLGGL